MKHSNLEVFPEEEKLVAELGLLGIHDSPEKSLL